MKKNVSILITYYYPTVKASGIYNYVSDLVKYLSKSVNLTIYSKRMKNEKKVYYKDHYKIIKIDPPFLINTFKLLNKSKDIIILFTGIGQIHLFILFLILINIFLKKKSKIILSVCAHLNHRLPIIFNFLLNKFNKIIVTHPEIAKQVNIKKVLIINPGIDIKKLKKIKLSPKKRDKIRIGFFGNFHPDKGAFFLLQAFKKMKHKNKVEIFLAGYSYKQERFLNHLKKFSKGYKNIIIKSYLHNIWKYIKSCDLIILPYKKVTSILGYSLTAMESMYYRIPVIGTITKPFKYLIIHNKNGLYCKNIDELSSQLDYLVKHHSVIRKLGNYAYKTIIKDFKIEQSANQYIKIINEVYNEKEGY